MKKPYEKISMTPLKLFTLEGNLLEASVVDTTVATTQISGQEVNSIDFSSEGNPFNTDWE